MKNSLHEEKTHFSCKNVLLYTINNLSVALEIIISQFSYSLKIMFQNIFPEPQPDIASYSHSIDIMLYIN